MKPRASNSLQQPRKSSLAWPSHFSKLILYHSPPGPLGSIHLAFQSTLSHFPLLGFGSCSSLCLESSSCPAQTPCMVSSFSSSAHLSSPQRALLSLHTPNLPCHSTISISFKAPSPDFIIYLFDLLIAMMVSVLQPSLTPCLLP